MFVFRFSFASMKHEQTKPGKRVIDLNICLPCYIFKQEKRKMLTMIVFRFSYACMKNEQAKSRKMRLI